jgi:hypothetical protein
MNNRELDELIDSSHFIADHLKEQCKQYLKQIPQGLGDWFYSSLIPQAAYQGDIVDKFEVVYYEVVDDRLEIQSLEDFPCMLLSHTCDMDLEDKTREKYVSVAPVFSFKEFAKFKTSEYSEKGWNDFLDAVKANRITDILYIPGKSPLDNSVILLDRISSVHPNLLKIRLQKGGTKRVLSLSQIGFYFFLIKLTYHFARYEDREEILRE